MGAGSITVGLIIWCSIHSPNVHAQTEHPNLPSVDWWQNLIQSFTEHFGALLIATIAGILAYVELRAHRRTAERIAEIEAKKLEVEQTAAEKRAEIEEQRFKAEEEERAKLVSFREQEKTRFSQTAQELAQQISRLLIDHPDWAHHALEAAKLLPYTHTIFGERSQHFQEEKRELAERFVPYLLKRCEALAMNDRHVFLMIDAGTTLYAFFEVIGRDTVRRFHRGENWLNRLHLVTNNLPGIEQLIKSGRRVPEDRYTNLAIENCLLLPGFPVPIFGAVAGKETNDAIRNLRNQYISEDGKREVTFVALVVGNWIRIREEVPRCPVAMARGREHLEVKQSFVENADEIFVVSPLGKIFVNHSKDQINNALGLTGTPRDPESEPYDDVKIDEKAQRVKLVSTTRAAGHLLHRHSNRVEDALTAGSKTLLPSDQEFASTAIQELPHLLFTFGLQKTKYEQFIVEFPHYHTRTNRQFLEMFGVDPEHVLQAS
jgi:hypothetical protein